MRRMAFCLLILALILLAAGCDLLLPDATIPPIGDSEFVDLEANLVAYYPFSGSADDESRWGNHGDPKGPILVADRFGNPVSAYHFDGNDDVIVAPSGTHIEILGPITLAAWIYPEEEKSQEIVVKGARVQIDPGTGQLEGFHPYGLALSATGDVIFSLSPDLQATQVRKHGYPTSTWFHVAGVYDGDSMMLYVDGELVAVEVVTGSLAGEADPLLIGTRLSLPSSTFKGVIDEVRIYDHALTEGEIKLLAK